MLTCFRPARQRASRCAFTSEPASPYRLLPALSGDGRAIAFTSPGMGSLSLVIEDIGSRRRRARLPLRRPIERLLPSRTGSSVLYRYGGGDSSLYLAPDGRVEARGESGPLHDWSGDERFVVAEDVAGDVHFCAALSPTYPSI